MIDKVFGSYGCTVSRIYSLFIVIIECGDLKVGFESRRVLIMF